MADTYQAHVGGPNVSPVLQAGLIDWSRAIEGGAQVGLQFAEQQQRAVDSAVRNQTEMAALPDKLRLLRAQADNLEQEKAVLPQKLQLMAAEASLSTERAKSLHLQNEVQDAVNSAYTREEMQANYRTITDLNLAKQRAETQAATEAAKTEVMRQQNFSSHTAAFGKKIAAIKADYDAGRIDVLQAKSMLASAGAEHWAADPALINSAGRFVDEQSALPDTLVASVPETGPDGKTSMVTKEITVTRGAKAQFAEAQRTHAAINPGAAPLTYSDFVAGQNAGAVLQQYEGKIASLQSTLGMTRSEAVDFDRQTSLLNKSQASLSLSNARAMSAVGNLTSNFDKLTVPGADGAGASPFEKTSTTYKQKMSDLWKLAKTNIEAGNGEAPCNLRLDGSPVENMTWNQFAQGVGVKLKTVLGQSVAVTAQQRAQALGGLPTLTAPMYLQPEKYVLPETTPEHYAQNRDLWSAQAVARMAKQALPQLKTKLNSTSAESPERDRAQTAVYLAETIVDEFPRHFGTVESAQQAMRLLKAKFNLSDEQFNSLMGAGAVESQARYLGMGPVSASKARDLLQDVSAKFYAGLGLTPSFGGDSAFAAQIQQTLDGIQSATPASSPGLPGATGAGTAAPAAGGTPLDGLLPPKPATK